MIIIKLASVSCKPSSNFDDWDREVLFEATKCCEALARRFAGWSFHPYKVKTCEWNVSTVCEARTDKGPTLSMSLFAEGFLASRPLWER